MASIASIDFETRGTVDLRKTGADVYAEHPHTGVWCMAWAIDDDPVELWCPGDPDPDRLLNHIAKGGMVRGWNVNFEDCIWRHTLPRIVPHWPALPVEQQDDTMARAYALGFPGALEHAAPALRLDIKKDDTGRRIMLQLAKPKVSRKAVPGAPPKWIDDEDKLARLKAYCRQDVEVERAIAKRLSALSARERRVWVLDRKINQRGVSIDMASVELAHKIVSRESDRLNAELAEVTGLFARNTKAPAEIRAFAESRGVILEDMTKDSVRTALRTENEIPDDVRRALEIRAEAGKSSTSKLATMKLSVNGDGRARGLFSYHGASTGRWVGRRIQLQNMPRPTLTDAQIDECFRLFRHPCAEDAIRFSFAAPMDAVSSCLRGMIIPAEGHRFLGGDFSNIEGRTIAWLAGEKWKLKAFADYDASVILGDDGLPVLDKKGEKQFALPDLYKVAYGRSFGVDPSSVDKAQRQVGKVQELALGYAGGPAAFIGMAANYDADIHEICRQTIAATDPDDWLDHVESTKRWKQHLAHYGRLKDQISFDEWLALRLIVGRWREAHPRIKLFWSDLNDCAMRAVQSRGSVETTETGLISFVSTGAFLFMRLPSSRCLAYPYPHIKLEKDEDTGEERLGLRSYGVDQKTKRWAAQRLYGGLLAENAASGVARDFLVDSMFRAERAGLPNVLHVHDEHLCEIPDDHPMTVYQFEALMCASEPWAKGLPVAASAWTGYRYGK